MYDYTFLYLLSNSKNFKPLTDGTYEIVVINGNTFNDFIFYLYTLFIYFISIQITKATILVLMFKNSSNLTKIKLDFNNRQTKVDDRPKVTLI